MTFHCPGCHQVHPLEVGQLVIDAGKQQRTNRPNSKPEDVLVVILCPPCAADLVLTRAGISGWRAEFVGADD